MCIYIKYISKTKVPFMNRIKWKATSNSHSNGKDDISSEKLQDTFLP